MNANLSKWYVCNFNGPFSNLRIRHVTSHPTEVGYIGCKKISQLLISHLQHNPRVLRVPSFVNRGKTHRPLSLEYHEPLQITFLPVQAHYPPPIPYHNHLLPHSPTSCALRAHPTSHSPITIASFQFTELLSNGPVLSLRSIFPANNSLSRIARNGEQWLSGKRCVIVKLGASAMATRQLPLSHLTIARASCPPRILARGNRGREPMAKEGGLGK